MSYEKHVWGGGVPNRNKLIDMDEGIEALDSNKMDKPSNTGTIGQVLKKTATGSEWSNGGGGGSTAGDITYDSTATYADGTVGKELKEQSENIVKLGDIDITEPKVVGRYIYYDSESNKVYKPIYQKSFHITENWIYYPHGIVGMENLLSCYYSAKGTDGTFYYNAWAAASDSRDFIAIRPTTMFVIAVNDNVSPRGIEFVDITLRYTLSTDTPTVIE